MKAAAELRTLADRVPAGGLPAGTRARQRAAGAAGAVAAALGTDPTLAERQQRRLAPLARQSSAAIESERLAAIGESTAHLGRINPLAAEELDAVSARCAELAAQVAAEAWPDWESPARVRELSSRRMPGEHENVAGQSHFKQGAVSIGHSDGDTRLDMGPSRRTAIVPGSGQIRDRPDAHEATALRPMSSRVSL